MTSNEQRGLDAAVAAGTPKSIRDYRSHRERIADAIAAYLEATATPALPQLRGDGEAAIIECLAAGKPFVFDPATNFLHADDGTVEYGIRYVPDDRQPAPADHVVGSALADALAERQRQLEAEGWSPTHDDQYRQNELVRAAMCYLLGNPGSWPWAYDWWKPGDPRRNLIKAAALIIAEIERLDRATATPEKQP